MKFLHLSQIHCQSISWDDSLFPAPTPLFHIPLYFSWWQVDNSSNMFSQTCSLTILWCILIRLAQDLLAPEAACQKLLPAYLVMCFSHSLVWKKQKGWGYRADEEGGVARLRALDTSSPHSSPPHFYSVPLFQTREWGGGSVEASGWMEVRILLPICCLNGSALTSANMVARQVGLVG